MLSKRAIVTGATGGLGLATAAALARAGCRVMVTGRDIGKGEAALNHLRETAPRGMIEFRQLDVADLGAIARFAEENQGPLDILINNAAVMGYPGRRTTVDGFEAQFGTNYLGHFALTLRMLPALTASGGARVVTVGSLAHRRARIQFDNLNGERSYAARGAYGQSKLAQLMFARALQRRAEARGWSLRSIAAHPGWSATRIFRGFGGARGIIAQAAVGLLAQSAEDGARAIVYAALDPAAEPGAYYGPSGIGETRGPTAPASMSREAQDDAVADRLWALSEQMTGIRLPSDRAAA